MKKVRLIKTRNVTHTHTNTHTHTHTHTKGIQGKNHLNNTTEMQLSKPRLVETL